MQWDDIEFNPSEFNTDREYEVRWVIERLNGGGRLLDVGCLDSKFAELMLPYYDEVWGIDIRSKDDRGRSDPKPYNFIVGNIINYKFRVVFNEITFISSLEHIGLDAYTNKDIDLDADRKSLNACHGILDDGGRIFITIPYSERSEGGRYMGGVMWERIYSDKSLDKLIDTDLFTIDTIDYVDRNANIILSRRS